MNRLFLHAHKIEFTHPINNKLIQITSELPENLECFLESIRK